MTETLKPRSFVTLFVRHGGFWLLFFILFAAIPGMIGYAYATDASDFAQQSVSTTAELISKEIRRTPRSAGSSESAIPYGTVRFLVDGEAILASSRISQGYYDRLERGQQITIRYLPDRPRTVELESGINLKFALITGGIVLIALGGWCFVVWRGFQYARNAIFVRTHGTRQLVAVTEHRGPMFSSDRKRETQLVWLDSSGREGISLPLPEDQAKAYRVGREVAIYELPGSGRASCWEGDVGHV